MGGDQKDLYERLKTQENMLKWSVKKVRYFALDFEEAFREKINHHYLGGGGGRVSVCVCVSNCFCRLKGGSKFLIGSTRGVKYKPIFCPAVRPGNLVIHNGMWGKLSKNTSKSVANKMFNTPKKHVFDRSIRRLGGGGLENICLTSGGRVSQNKPIR